MNGPDWMGEGLTPDAVSKVIEFHKTDESLRAIQAEGVAGLWNIMRRKKFAYLADEVGMGKTWQAMGIIALALLHKPDARIVVLCPGQDLQRKWQNNWIQFVKNCYRPYDNRVRNRFDGGIALEAIFSDRLRNFVDHLVLNFEQLHVLRYSSFSRPFWFNHKHSLDEIEKRYLDLIWNLVRPRQLTTLEQEAFKKAKKSEEGLKSYETLSQELNAIYAEEAGKVVSKRKIDLLIFDEAQYLRHINNARNTHLRQVFSPENVGSFLFLSATPIHSGPGDILSLNSYLSGSGEAGGDDEPIKISKSGDDFVSSMREFMVRRVRTYKDGNARNYSKHKYRNYEKKSFDSRNDAFYSLTLALVQKDLVKALVGQGNRFRLGECSSFESLQASVPGEKEYENTEGNSGDTAQGEESPDRGFIDCLSRRFLNAMKKFSMGFCQLPHGKIDQMIELLREIYLANSPNEKAIVFVRRLDTVDEIKHRLELEFQREVDKRIESWSEFIPGGKSILSGFWEREDSSARGDIVPTVGLDSDEESSFDTQAKIPFLRALRRGRTQGERNGKLYSFSNRLLQQTEKSRSPLLFLVGDERIEDVEGEWGQLLEILIGKHQPLKDSHDLPCERLKEKALKRCILQSLRRSDFIVDLYIMNMKEVRGSTPLSEVLLRCLDGTFKFAGSEGTISEASGLGQYFVNWGTRLRNLVEHWGLILDNCLPNLKEEGWNGIVDKLFYHVTPVAARSGRIYAEQTVNQFKLPGFPNVLVCTDVLKEGIDLHLFCTKVYHYGVAWTSGDLEQRIGRVDRFMSQIARDIAAFNGECDGLPKMGIYFPSLAGTLDDKQVDHVRRRKALADMVMDFGQNHVEHAEQDIDSLYESLTGLACAPSEGEKSLFTPKFRGITAGHLPLADVGGRENGALVERGRRIMKSLSSVMEGRTNWQDNMGWELQLEDSWWRLRYLPAFECFKLTYAVPELLKDFLRPNCRLTRLKNSGKWTFYRKRDLLLQEKENGGLLDLLKVFVAEDVQGCPRRALSRLPGFSFCSEFKAYTRVESIRSLVADGKRSQHIFLETLGEAALLRSFVASRRTLETLENIEIKKGVERFIVQLNEQCKIGHFWFEESGDLFYLVPVHDKHLITDRMLHQIALFADTVQMWLTADDDDNFIYRTPFSLKGVVEQCQIGNVLEWGENIQSWLGA